MAVGLQKLVRRALLAKLKANGALTALVPAAKINPDGTPSRPFIELNAPVTLRRRMTGSNAGTVTWDIHAFADPRKDGGGQIVETAEDHAGSIGAAIETALADNNIALEGGGTARIILSDIRLLKDGDVDSYHWFAQVNARVLAA